MGYVDLVSAGADRLDVLDFKTDARPAGAVKDAYPEYVKQVRLYGLLLPDVFGGRRLPWACFSRPTAASAGSSQRCRAEPLTSAPRTFQKCLVGSMRLS
jgi:hypothetical protein